MEDREKLLLAANTLLRGAEAVELYRNLLDVAVLPRNLPVKLTGEAADLNPLLALYRADKAAFDNLIARIDARREQQSLPPLNAAPPKKKFDKNAYQRELMASIRSHTIPAARIENLRRPPSGQLVGAARLEFMRQQGKKWSVRLKAAIDAISDGRPISRDTRRMATDRFWGWIDKELAEQEAEVMRWIQNGRKGEAP